MSDEKTTFTPAEAAEWLKVDYSQFMLTWLPGYAKFLSEPARSADPVLSQLDLALFERIMEFRRAGHGHRQIRAVLAKFWKPELQVALPALVTEISRRQKAARRK